MTTQGNWYDLFSRGARDWLRHNEKVRDAVRRSLPQVLSESDILTNPEQRTVRIPVHLLEHYRFQLAEPASSTGVGQGDDIKPGDVLRQGQPSSGHRGEGSGEGEGEPNFVLEMKISDIVEWLWEELELPRLRPKMSGPLLEEEWQREGIDRHGARARLDRRRTLKESIKRRIVQPEGAPITNDDLRYRQLVRRPRPVTAAVVIMALDVSASMDERSRRMAKNFFFWVLQGLRRRYQHIEPVFIAHTVTAWEFDEEEFFKVTASGGTVASSAFKLAHEIFTSRYDPSRYNGYLLYASDGENFPEDRQPALDALRRLGEILNFTGYVEVLPDARGDADTGTGRIFNRLAREGVPARRYVLMDEEDIWEAIRAFFHQEAKEAA